MLRITIHAKSIYAQFMNNPSADAFKEKLRSGPVKVSMEDYGNFEKVGPLGFNLPRTDERITTQYGDVILYQGDKITIYYDTNTWTFTKLGHIQNITQNQIKKFLTNGDVDVEFSLGNENSVNDSLDDLPQPENSPKDKKKIIGIAVGVTLAVIVVVAAIIITIIYLKRKKSNK